MKAAATFLLLSSLICLGNADLNGSMPLVASQNEWGLLEEVLGTLLQKEQQLVSELDQLHDDDSDDGEWVMQVKGGLENAIRIANQTKITLKRQVRGLNDYFVFERENPVGSRSKRSVGEFKRHIFEDQAVIWAEHQTQRIRTKRVLKFNDPLWNEQWEMKRETKTNRGSMRIPEVWNSGITGRGVVVSILDDGIDHSHPDLKPNYEPRASYDLNGDDVDPMPTMNDDNKHGTRCAGEIAMVANNSVCGVGVAFNSRIAGVRMLDGVITDRSEGEALTTGLGLVDIYSASWGPSDDGNAVEGPGRLAMSGIYRGITEGRNGKGVIYVWASGNGGSNGDNCNCDGYASSIYTFSVSAATEDGDVPWYSEACSSILVATYSSGSKSDSMIATTDTQGRCTTQHTGTSAAAPLAAGIIALGLEANPSLTWRDVQHLAVWTANPAPLMKSGGDWHMNGVGLLVSNRFGFGLMDALNFVTLAKSWRTVPALTACSVPVVNILQRSIFSSGDTVVRIPVDACRGKPNQINFLESVQLKATISHTRRGNLEIYLISPKGTKTQLLSRRPKDDDKRGFQSWPFMSLHTWGENPQGMWELHVVDVGTPKSPSSGKIEELTLTLYGTKDAPAHYSQRRTYSGVDFGVLKYQKRAPMANMTGITQNQAANSPVFTSKRSMASEAVVEELTRLPRLARNPRKLNSLVAELVHSRHERP